MIKIIKVKLNVDMLSYLKGSILTLTTQQNSNSGIFLSPYFNNRIKDSKIDNCLEIISESENESIKTPIKEIEVMEIEKVKQEEESTEKSPEKPKKRGRKKSK